MKVVKIILGSFIFLTLPAFSAPLLTTHAQTAKSVELAFDNLNDFVTKGLPAPGPLPTENLDLAAMMMAQKISKGDEQSLPVLLTALQTAGFTIIDENGKPLLLPADGNGQGLAIYDFEAVGALKLARNGQGTSLEKIVGIITKDAPEISASQFSELMLQDLRTLADNSEDKFLRFWARLIIELGKSSAQPVDLMTVTSSNANLSMLQATLLIRRLQGDLYLLKTQSPPIGEIRPPSFQRNGFVSVNWQKDDSPIFSPFSQRVKKIEPCNLTKEESYIMGGASKILVWGNRKVLGYVFGKGAGSVGYGQIRQGLSGANMALSWLKLVAAVTSMRGEITVEKPLPLKRTPNAEPGAKRLMKVRIWNEVGRLEMLNCVRIYLNTFAGLDVAVPIPGALSHIAIEWHFAADNETRVNDAQTRNFEKFVTFEAPAGKDRNPQKQETNKDGEAEMFLVGAPKKPPVVNQKNAIEIEKQAKVVVAITLKSAKDFLQNTIDLMGLVLTLPGGPVGTLMGIMTETGYRLPYAVARATIPVTDHEPCDGQWHGTITCTHKDTSKSKTIQSRGPGHQKTRDGTDGGYENQDSTTTLSGTVVVNGNKQLVNSSADEIFVSDEFAFGTNVCSRRGVPYGQLPPLTAVNNRSSKLRYGGGSAQEEVKVAGISLYKDNYRISIQPRAVNGTLHSTTQISGINCPPKGSSSTSYTNSFKSQWGTPLLDAIANYGEDRNILSGSFTETSPPNPPVLARVVGPYDDWIHTTTSSHTTVSTITWNLRRCN